uniref:Transmembrane protein n=1 Tax=Panagrellus redivivus TaxID=6233 RepID=A0A7E4VI84_PANRE
MPTPVLHRSTLSTSTYPSAQLVRELPPPSNENTANDGTSQPSTILNTVVVTSVVLACGIVIVGAVFWLRYRKLYSRRKNQPPAQPEQNQGEDVTPRSESSPASSGQEASGRSAPKIEPQPRSDNESAKQNVNSNMASPDCQSNRYSSVKPANDEHQRAMGSN